MDHLRPSNADSKEQSVTSTLISNVKQETIKTENGRDSTPSTQTSVNPQKPKMNPIAFLPAERQAEVFQAAKKRKEESQRKAVLSSTRQKLVLYVFGASAAALTLYCVTRLLFGDWVNKALRVLIRA